MDLFPLSYSGKGTYPDVLELERIEGPYLLFKYRDGQFVVLLVVSLAEREENITDEIVLGV